MSLPRAIRHFLGREDGSVTVEAVLIFPILCWAYLGTFSFFDAFRAESVNVKTAYTIGDILSRQENYVTPEFLDSMFALQDVLTDTEEPTQVRITSVRFIDGALERRWSKVRGTGVVAHTTATVRGLDDRIPELSDGEYVILTETWMEYTPPFNVGMGPFTFAEVAVTPPREGRFCYSPHDDGGTPSDEEC